MTSSAFLANGARISSATPPMKTPCTSVLPTSPRKATPAAIIASATPTSAMVSSGASGCHERGAGAGAWAPWAWPPGARLGLRGLEHGGHGSSPSARIGSTNVAVACTSSSCWRSGPTGVR